MTTTIVWGSVEPLNFFDIRISDIIDLTITSRSPSRVAGDYRLTGQPDVENEFFGSGFVFDSAGNPIDGVISSLVLTNSGQLVGRFDGLSVPVSQFISLAVSGDDELARATILAGNDTVSGSPFGDFVQGYTGNDLIALGAGDDIAFGGPGNDVVDGSSGVDTLLLGGSAAEYQLVVWREIVGAIPLNGELLTGDGVDKGLGIELLAFVSTGEVVDVPFENFSPLEYIASYGDLAAVFGTNPNAGFDHYIYSGAYEGRTTSFSGLEYVASYGDLQTAFGPNGDAGAAHYISAGRSEGRVVSFDDLQYIASYGDLIVAFGANGNAGTAHFIQTGAGEDRVPDTFDAARYLANYADLRAAFGTNTEAATLHFITNGFAEGRTDELTGSAAATSADFML